jgi:hypothetical protein
LRKFNDIFLAFVGVVATAPSIKKRLKKQRGYNMKIIHSNESFLVSDGAVSCVFTQYEINFGCVTLKNRGVFAGNIAPDNSEEFKEKLIEAVENLVLKTIEEFESPTKAEIQANQKKGAL